MQYQHTNTSHNRTRFRKDPLQSKVERSPSGERR